MSEDITDEGDEVESGVGDAETQEAREAGHCFAGPPYRGPALPRARTYRGPALRGSVHDSGKYRLSGPEFLSIRPLVETFVQNDAASHPDQDAVRRLSNR